MCRPILYVIPCGAEKADRPVAARDLYLSPNFRLTLAAAEAQGDGEVVILSAYHGIVRLDEIVEPYDVKMGDRDSIDVESLTAQLTRYEDHEVFSFCPKAYFARLDEAARELGIYPTDIHEANPGIGYQRGTSSRLVAGLI